MAHEFHEQLGALLRRNAPLPEIIQHFPKNSAMNRDIFKHLFKNVIFYNNSHRRYIMWWFFKQHLSYLPRETIINWCEDEITKTLMKTSMEIVSGEIDAGSKRCIISRLIAARGHVLGSISTRINNVTCSKL
jgi:hypothetical protein